MLLDELYLTVAGYYQALPTQTPSLASFHATNQMLCLSGRMASVSLMMTWKNWWLGSSSKPLTARAAKSLGNWGGEGGQPWTPGWGGGSGQN